MKLLTGTASPYARKVNIAIREKGVLAQTEEIIAAPRSNPPALVAVNPISQIPTLVLDDGSSIIDSSLICAWLDHKFDNGIQLYPKDIDALFDIRRDEMIANSILEMSVKIVLEKMRPESEQSPTWIKRWTENALRSFEVSEGLAKKYEGEFNIVTLTLGVAATYFEYRFPEIDWKTKKPYLIKLQETLEKRESFIATYPK